MRGAIEDETMTAWVTMATRERSPRQAGHNLRRAPEPNYRGLTSSVRFGELGRHPEHEAGSCAALPRVGSDGPDRARRSGRRREGQFGSFPTWPSPWWTVVGRTRTALVVASVTAAVVTSAAGSVVDRLEKPRAPTARGRSAHWCWRSTAG